MRTNFLAGTYQVQQVKTRPGIIEAFIVDIEYTDNFGWANVKDLKPIPITPQWLERLGFSKNYVFSEDFLEHESNVFGDFLKDETFWVSDFEYNESITFVLYVHELQMAFALFRGELLEIKD